MNTILIDYTKIISDKDRIKSIIPRAPSPLKGFYPGLVIITKNNIINSLSSLKSGNDRIKYINSDEFLQSIEEQYYIMYNEKRKICILECNCEKYLQKILNVLFSEFPSDTFIWVGIDLSHKNFTNTLNTFIKNGFTSPYVTTLSPMYTDIPASAVLIRQNILSNTNINTTLNKVFYAIEQYNNNNKSCYLFARLSQQAINFLRQTSKKKINKKESQKELTGELFVKDVVYINNKFVYIINIDKSSVESGEEENVNVSATRYNFHSHPHEAYVRHSVDKAWPSVTDYLGYHKLGENTIFHCVATLEGLYIMSFSPYWGSNLKKVSRKFIDKNFEIDHKEPYTPEEYVKKINSILYKNNPIFEVKYFPWNKANTIFKVFFPQTGSSCLPSEKIVEKYKKIYN